ncbi:helix-hairpin-helix domain-containing protein [Streptomyces niveus]|uniref:helix-hairpin-helix domain-containing protein n=1 Tax=Streptomyces niveus TaxID=193462 RepID=UPI0036C9F4D6
MTSAHDESDLTELVNVGRSVARYFEGVGVTRIAQLVGEDPVELYERMSAAAGQRLDPCLLDTVMSAVDQAEGGPARPWWHYTPERKRLQAERQTRLPSGPAGPSGP